MAGGRRFGAVAELIGSASNPLVKRLRLLRDRKHRQRQGAFVVEGVQPVSQAVAAGAVLEALVVAPELLHAEPVHELVAAQAAQGVRVARLTAELFTRLSPRDGPAGLAAIVRTWHTPLDDLPAGADAVFVALHEIGNPGNLGSIVRTADAAGASGLILIGPTADPYDPAAVKASMGALFQVPIARAATVGEFFGWAAAGAVTVATTSAQADQGYREATYPRPLALLLGSEGRGLPAPVLDQGDLRLRIPMVGTAESLNLAVAAGILLYEACRPGSARQRSTT